MQLQFLDRVERFIRRLRVRRCQTPFVVLFIDRSGSSHVCSALDSHKDVLCRREDFCEFRMEPAEQTYPIKKPASNLHSGFLRQIHGFGPAPIVEPSSKQVRTHLHDIFSLPAPACGFKFKIPIQLKLFPEIDRELRRMAGELKVIAIYRANPLKQAISRQNLRRIQLKSGNTQHNLEPGSSLGPLRIDTEALLTSVQNIQSARQTLDELVADYEAIGVKVMRMEYEQLDQKPSGVFQEILSFLNVDPEIQLVSSYSKATPDDLREAIANYDDLQKAVAGTDLEKYL